MFLILYMTSNDTYSRWSHWRGRWYTIHTAFFFVSWIDATYVCLWCLCFITDKLCVEAWLLAIYVQRYIFSTSQPESYLNKTSSLTVLQSLYSRNSHLLYVSSSCLLNPSIYFDSHYLEHHSTLHPIDMALKLIELRKDSSTHISKNSKTHTKNRKKMTNWTEYRPFTTVAEKYSQLWP